VSDGASRSEIHSINITIEVKTLEGGKIDPLTTKYPTIREFSLYGLKSKDWI
jgi:hypothetical protein